MVGYQWFTRNKVGGLEYQIARSLLMTGPRATLPTFRAIRKMVARLRRGDKPGAHGYGSWRSAPAIKVADVV